jgi:hypothetical protein
MLTGHSAHAPSQKLPDPIGARRGRSAAAPREAARYPFGVSPPGLRDWKACTPVDVNQWLKSTTATWWIAGGWALDLFCGMRTRSHADVDVGCFREDLSEIRAALGDWVVCAAHQGRLRALAPTVVPGDEVHSVWCRPAEAQEWWLEVMLDEREGQNWVFRRSPGIRRPARDLLSRDADGTPYLRPEIQLLYKAKSRRPRDEDDFRVVLPRLDARATRWLRDALSRCEPQHPWLEQLRRAV